MCNDGCQRVGGAANWRIARGGHSLVARSAVGVNKPSAMRVVLSLVLVVAAVSCDAPSDCSPTTCAGCCDPSGQCVGGSAQLACGSGGLLCNVCSGAQVCLAGLCTAAMTPATVSGTLAVFQGAQSARRVGASALPAGLRQHFAGAGPVCRQPAPAEAMRAALSAAQRAPVIPVGHGPLGTGPGPDAREGEVLVRFEAKLTAGQALAALRRKDVTLEHGGFGSEWLHLVVAKDHAGRRLALGATTELAAQLRQVAGVRYTALNHVHRALRVPNDPLYTAQWHYAAMNLPSAWDLTTGSASTVVAVLDTGVINHPDLQPKLLSGVDMVSDPANGADGDGRDDNPNDEGGDLPQGASSWHGSHVAGTVAASSDDNQGVSGVAWTAKLLPVRVLGRQGGSDLDIAAGITWASGGVVPGSRANTTPAQVLNLSLGRQGDPSEATRDVISQAIARGAILTVAAGNDNIEAARFTPCNQDGVICVGATRFNGRRASYSNYGVRVDVMAPGGEVAEDSNGDRYPDGVLSTSREGSNAAYVFEQGTSMASPHVAGVLALMKARNPQLTAAQAKMLLTSTANTASRCTEGCGAGLVNAQAAVQAASGMAPSGPGRLATTTSELYFTAQSTTQNVTVSNVGGSALSVTVGAGGTEGSRLSVGGAATRTLMPNQSDTLAITANLGGLAAGVHTANVVLSAGSAGAFTINVRLKAGSTALARPPVVALVYEADGGWNAAGAAEANTSTLAYQLSAPPGTYYVFGYLDSNGNDSLESNEPVGIWPNMDAPRQVTLAGGQAQDKVDFVLAPEVSVTDTESRLIGAPCGNDAACGTGGFCVTAWPGGYCSTSCLTTACPTGSICLEASTDTRLCLDSCSAPGQGQSSCRAGYVCYSDGAGRGLCAARCTSAADCGGTPCDTATGYCQ